MTVENILYITHGFPYVREDVFSMDEFPYLFDKKCNIYIFPRLGAPSEPCIDVQNATIIDDFLNSRKSKILSLFSFSFFELLKAEILECLKYKKSFRIFPFFRSAAIALHAKNVFSRFISKRSFEKTPITIYFFWYSEAVIGAYFIKKRFPQVRIVVRLHGGDLYPVQWTHGYIPFRYFRAQCADYFAPCSQHGVDFLISEGFDPAKVCVAYLGVPPVDRLCPSSAAGELHLVSCSFVFSVKRLPLLVRSLHALAIRHPEMRIVWHHIGDGTNEDSQHLRNIAHEMLKCLDNFEYYFHGVLSTSEIRTYLASADTPLDCLVNVSESEGLPVSMMEAIAAGIPLIGTDVGGVHEIVNETTGKLLPQNFTIEEFIEAVRSIMLLKEPDKRRHIVRFFSTYFNMEHNYSLFVKKYLRSP